MLIDNIKKGTIILNSTNDLIKLQPNIVKAYQLYALLDESIITHRANSTPSTLLGNILYTKVSSCVNIILMFDMWSGSHNKSYISLDYLQECLHILTLLGQCSKDILYFEKDIEIDIAKKDQFIQIYQSIIKYHIPRATFV